MRLAVLGCGIQAKAIVSDLLKQDDVEKIILADRYMGVVVKMASLFPGATEAGKFELREFNAASTISAVNVLEGVDACVSALPYRCNYWISEAAIKSKTDMCDLGGSNAISEKQARLSDAAKKADISIVREVGLAPGLVSIIAADANNYLDVDNIKLRVGGLPAKYDPDSQWNYFQTFSADGLINEYREPATILRGGKIVTVPSLGDHESLGGLGGDPLEAFTTSGGAATLPQTYKGRIANLDYKTIRYKGHWTVLKGLEELGFFSDEELCSKLKKQIGLMPRGNDRIILRCWAWGRRRGETGTESRIYKCDEYGDSEFSAMAKMTGYPASIVLLMLGRRQIPPGVQPQESVIDPALFFEELGKRGIKLTIT